MADAEIFGEDQVAGPVVPVAKATAPVAAPAQAPAQPEILGEDQVVGPVAAPKPQVFGKEALMPGTAPMDHAAVKGAVNSPVGKAIQNQAAEEEYHSPGFVIKEAYSGLKGTFGDSPLVTGSKRANAEARVIADLATGGYASKLLDVAQSGVGKAFKYLGYGANAVTAGVTWGLDKSIAPGIQKVLNPEGKVVPDIMLGDVVNYGAPSHDDVYNYFRETGMNPFLAGTMANAYWFGKTGLGLGLSIIGDPSMWVGNVYGVPAKAMEAYKLGASPTERFLFELKAPFTKSGVEIGQGAEKIGPAISSAAAKTREVVESAPVVGGTISKGISKVENAAHTGREMLDSLNPWTGIQQLDMESAGHKALSRGDKNITEQTIQEWQKLKLSKEESDVIASVVEDSPNLRPSNVPTSAPKSPESVTAEIKGSKTGISKEELTPVLAEKIAKHAEEAKLSIAPGRAEDLVAGALLIKSHNSYTLGRSIETGFHTAEEIEHFARDNYLAHSLSPEAKAALYKNPELAMAMEEAKQQSTVTRTAGPKNIFDVAGKERKIEGTIQQANKIMEEKTNGKIAKWFVEDPLIATVQKNSQYLRQYRDNQYLSAIAKFGRVPESAAEERMLRLKGYEPVVHPTLGDRMVTLKTAGEESKSVRFRDILYPGPVASKLQYQIAPKAYGVMNNVNAYIDSYLRTFRKMALFRPDYHMENWIENVIKNMVNGVKIEDYVDLHKVFSGKPTDTIKIMKGGKQVEMKVQEIRDLMQSWDVRSNHITENTDALLYTGKKINDETGKFRNMTTEKLKEYFSIMHKVGARGENITRQALFLNRIKQGFSPKMAAFEVEKWLFDFGRTTQSMDFVRRFLMPFGQAPIKTAFIAGELIRKKPGLYSTYENTLPHVIQNSFNDPVTAWAISQANSQFDTLRDPIAGPLFPSNSWLAVMFGGDPKGKNPMPFAIQLRLPGAAGILNQLNLLDNTVNRNMSSGPIWRMFNILSTGKDTWTGQNIDPNDPSYVSKKLNLAISAGVLSAFASPQIEKLVRQKFKLIPSEYVTPTSVALMNGAFSKFGRVVNLQKEFMFRQIALAQIEKGLKTYLMKEYGAEVTGKTPDIVMQGAPKTLTDMMRIVMGAPMSAGQEHEDIQNQENQMRQLQIAQGYLMSNKPTAGQVIGMLKLLHDSVKGNVDAFNYSMEQYLKYANEQKGKINPAFGSPSPMPSASTSPAAPAASGP